MKVRYREVTYGEVTLDAQEEFRVTREVLQRVFNLPERAYVDDEDYLVKIEEFSGGSHSWDE